MVKKIVIGIVVALVLFVGLVASRPSQYRVERSVSIAAPANIVFAELEDLKRWAAWSPWDKLDPNMEKTFAGPPTGVGASYAWSGNDQVGKGKMTVVESAPPSRVVYQLEFFEPWESTATTALALEQRAGEDVRVTWTMEGNNGFVEKAFGLFMDMDGMIGADFEKGLADLKTVAEANARAAAAVPPAAPPAATP